MGHLITCLIIIIVGALLRCSHSKTIRCANLGPDGPSKNSIQLEMVHDFIVVDATPQPADYCYQLAKMQVDCDMIGHWKLYAFHQAH